MTNFVESVAYGMWDVATAGRGISRRIGGEPIRLPFRWRRHFPLDCDPAAFAVLRTHCEPGHVVMDIRAHLGLFSVVMARRVGATGRVFSFEPTDRVRAVLEETMRLNQCDDVVEIRREAVGGATTPVARYYDTGEPLASANGLIRTTDCRATTIVPTVTVDDFIARQGISVQFLRIDAEGAELDVLRGARQTLTMCRPAVLLSLHPRVSRQDGAGLAEVWDVLHGCGMTMLRHGRRVHRREFRRHDEPFDVELIPEETVPPYNLSTER